MPSHPLARFAGCFATGALAAALALIGLDQAAALDPSLKVAWFWFGGNGAVALGFVLLRARRPRGCGADR